MRRRSPARRRSSSISPITLEDYTADLDQAHGNALGALSLLPDIQRAAERFARLAEDEQNDRRADRHVRLGQRRAASQPDVGADEGARRRRSRRRAKPCRTSFKEGQAHLATMRGLVSAPGAIEQRSDQFAAEAVELAGVISALEQTSIAPSVMRAAADLSVGFIAPVADGDSADLAGRQDQVMATIRTSVDAQSKALSDAAAEILAQPKVAERRFVPLIVGRSRAALCRGFHSELGRRHLHRPVARRARRHHVRWCMAPCGAARTISRMPTASPPATCCARSTCTKRCSPSGRPPSRRQAARSRRGYQPAAAETSRRLRRRGRPPRTSRR